MKESLFRNWVRQLWINNCEEHLAYGEKPYNSIAEYWQQYKWWIRREFRHQQSKENK